MELANYLHALGQTNVRSVDEPHWISYNRPLVCEYNNYVDIIALLFSMNKQVDLLAADSSLHNCVCNLMIYIGYSLQSKKPAFNTYMYYHEFS